MKNTNDENYKYASSRLPYRGVVENKLGIDLIDLAILDFMRSFASSGKCITMDFCGIRYFKITCNHISKNLPLLGISTKQGITRRLNRLVEKGILEYENNAGTGSYYSFTNLCESLGWEYALFSDKTDNENGHHRQLELSQPTTTVVTTDNGSCHPSISNNNISTINNCNKNNREEKYKKESVASPVAPLVAPPDLIDVISAYGKTGNLQNCILLWTGLTSVEKARVKKVVPAYVDETQDDNGRYRKTLVNFISERKWEEFAYLYKPKMSYRDGRIIIENDIFTDDDRPNGYTIEGFNKVWDAYGKMWRE